MELLSLRQCSAVWLAGEAVQYGFLFGLRVQLEHSPESISSALARGSIEIARGVHCHATVRHRAAGSACEVIQHRFLATLA